MSLAVAVRPSLADKPVLQVSTGNGKTSPISDLSRPPSGEPFPDGPLDKPADVHRRSNESSPCRHRKTQQSLHDPPNRLGILSMILCLALGISNVITGIVHPTLLIFAAIAM